MEKKLSDLRFADGVALTTENVKDMEHQQNILNEESLNIGLKIHKGNVFHCCCLSQIFIVSHLLYFYPVYLYVVCWRTLAEGYILQIWNQI